MNRQALQSLRVRALQVLSNRRLRRELSDSEAQELVLEAGSLTAALLALQQRILEGQGAPGVIVPNHRPPPSEPGNSPLDGSHAFREMPQEPMELSFDPHGPACPPAPASAVRSDAVHFESGRWASLLGTARSPIRTMFAGLRRLARCMVFRQK